MNFLWSKSTIFPSSHKGPVANSEELLRCGRLVAILASSLNSFDKGRDPCLLGAILCY